MAAAAVAAAGDSTTPCVGLAGVEKTRSPSLEARISRKSSSNWVSSSDAEYSSAIRDECV